MSEVLIIPEGKICDYIDGKFRNDTPEEYVRQNIEKRLVNEHNYSKDRLALEANSKRTEAYRAEQEAIRITNDEVIHASKND